MLGFATSGVANAQEEPPTQALHLTLQNDVDFIEAGQTLDYQLRLENLMSNPAKVDDLHLTLPPTLNFRAASIGGRAHPTATGVVLWSPFQIDAAGVTTRTVTVEAALPISTTAAVVEVKASAIISGEVEPPTASVVISDPLFSAGIVGIVWHDLNGNGLREAVEPGLAAVDVLITTVDRTLPFLRTDGEGHFHQPGLGSGAYDIALSGAPLADYPLRTAARAPTTLTLTSNVTETVAFGFVRPATLSGQLWREDSGVKGRQPLIDAPIVLFDANDAVVATARSGPSGAYQFTDLIPGSYRVTVDTAALPAGFAGIFEIDDVPDQHVALDLPSGAVRAGVDFGLAFRGAIGGGLVWRDGNENGQVDPGEAGIGNVTVEVRHAGADARIDTEDDRSVSVKTDSTGRFTFADLRPGRQRVRVIPTAGSPQIGLTADPDGTLDAQSEVTIAAGKTIDPLHFGYGPHDLALTISSQAEEGEPEGLVRYRLDYTNEGSVNAGDARLYTTVPVPASFVAAESSAWSCADGAPAGTPCELRLGALPPGQNDAIAFTVRLPAVMPAGSNVITQTATISDVIPGWLDGNPTNDRSTASVAVNAAPAFFLDVSDGNAARSPGEELVFEIDAGNVGNQDAIGARLTLLTPILTRFEPGASDPGWQCEATKSGRARCNFALDTLTVGLEQRIRFGVVVAPTVPANVTRIEAIITLEDATGRTISAAELTPLEATPDLQVQAAVPTTPKEPGMTIGYELTYANVGNQDAIGVLLIQTVPNYTTFNAPSSSPGWDCVDGSAAGVRCIFTVGTLAAGAQEAVRFAVTIDADLPPSVEEIRNSVVIVGAGVEQDVDNNQDDGVISVTIQSSVDLITWSATSQVDGTMLIRWETSAERDAWGFLVYRGVGNDWRETARITPALVPAQGTTTTGATYTVVDSGVQPDTRYRYWLQEIALDDSTVIYGPREAQVGAPSRITSGKTLYLPIITQN